MSSTERDRMNTKEQDHPEGNEEEIMRMSAIYAQELKTSYFPSRSSPSSQFNVVSESLKNEDLVASPYTQWKSQNKHLFNESPGGMSSTMGRNLEIMSDLSGSKSVKDNCTPSRYRTRRAPEHTSPHYMNYPVYAPDRSPELNHTTPPPPPHHTPYFNPYYSPSYQPSPTNYPPPPSRHPPPPCSCSHSYQSKASQKLVKSLEKKDQLRTKQMADLYRIAWLQNEQLNHFKAQLDKLTDLVSVQRNADKDLQLIKGKSTQKNYPKATKELRSFNLSVIKENHQELTEKVSVGIMTSFIDNKVTKSSSTQRNQSTSSDVSSSLGSSSEHDESDSEEQVNLPKHMSTSRTKRKSKKEESLNLQGVQIPTVIESPPSPQTSVHINMQDYRSSSSSETDDSKSSEEEDSGSDEEVEGNHHQVGWTFYDTVVGKVNGLLNRDNVRNIEPEQNDIRALTLDSLRRLGISIVDPGSPTNDVNPLKKVTFQGNEMRKRETDASVRMNALALKYLESPSPTGPAAPPDGGSDNGALTNLSLATRKYLEKYDLHTQKSQNKLKKSKKKKSKDSQRNDQLVAPKQVPSNKNKKKSDGRQMTSSSGKILDITAIKQQPKLLPKRIYEART